jgi:hypothetical protein
MDKMNIQKSKKKIILQQTSAVIYNTLSQNLCMAKLNLATIDLKEPVSALKKINQSKIIISKSISDLRKIADTLEML